jgi:nuclear pore complex protein Nup160
MSVQELECSSVAVLFATSSSVFRLLLPHPDAISKNPVLSSAVGGLQSSVLASVEGSSLQGSNMAALFSQHSSAQPITCGSGWISPSGAATFALASPSGSVHLIYLPSPLEHGLPVRTELKQFSVINRLWASVVPTAFRGGGPAEDAPVSVSLHSFSGNVVVLALCRDIHLRLWATEPAECIMTCDLVEYLLQGVEADSSLFSSKLCLRKAEGATATSLRFAVYIETEGGAQVSVFKLLVVDRHLHLEHVHSHPCRYEGDMVEMYCTNTAIWAIWKVRDGDVEDTVVQHFSYDGGKCHGWQSAHLSSPPPRDIYLPHNAEPRSIYLEALFHPGRFATSAINKALELYGNTSVKESIQQLREEATATVERELRSSSDSTQLQHEQFRELQVKCWMKFYGCCYEYQQVRTLHMTSAWYICVPSSA